MSWIQEYLEKEKAGEIRRLERDVTLDIAVNVSPCLSVFPISPITRGSCRQLPLRMAWGLTIHKSQGMTLQNVTIGIGNIDRQGLTFTTISRATSLSGLRISPPFSFPDTFECKAIDMSNVGNKRKAYLLQSL